MSILIDTSVWVDHFRLGNSALIDLIGCDFALTHPMIIAEIACGTPPVPRAQTLNSLALLKPCKQASLSDVMAFVEREKLYGQGCGVVDICLLASTLITPGATLWTLDKKLAALAERFDIGHKSIRH